MYLELYVIETKWLFLQKEGVNQIMMNHSIGTQSDRKSKTGVITVEPPYYAQVWEYPPWVQELLVVRYEEVHTA